MPFKANADRRHHIPAQQHRVKNWAEYDAGLRARGSLTVWFTAEAIEAWHAAPRTMRGSGRRFTCIQCFVVTSMAVSSWGRQTGRQKRKRPPRRAASFAVLVSS